MKKKIKKTYSNNNQKLLSAKKRLASTIRDHIDNQITIPAISLLDIAFQIHDDLASLLIMNKALRDLINQGDLGRLDRYLADAIKRNNISNHYCPVKIGQH